MATLHQNTEATRALQKSFDTAVEIFIQNIDGLTAATHNTVGDDWIGSSANSFLSDFSNWQGRMLDFTNELQDLSARLSKEISEWEQAGAALSVQPLPSNARDRQALRNWWHGILRDYGKYSAYAVFLILPSDQQAIKYLTEYGQELDLLSGASCLAIVFGESGPLNRSFDKHHWDSSTQEHVSKGYSLRMAEMFNINYSQFPCMLVFEDVRSADHVAISLKDMSQREIAETMRLAFAVIKEADLNNTSPLNALNERNRIDAYRKASQSLINGARNLGSKTLESAIEAIIKGAIS